MVRTAGLRMSDFTESGLLDNADVVWKNLEFVMWNYNGNVSEDVPALKITMGTDDGDQDQYFSCGKGSDWEPSDDGRRLEAKGNASGINKQSKLGILIKSLIKAGFPEDKISDDCWVFKGLECHMVREEDGKRLGLTSTPRADGREFARTNLVVDLISKLPWDKKGTKANTKTSGNSEAPKAEEESNDDDVTQAAMEVVEEILKANPKGISKKNLASLVFKNTKQHPHKNAIWKLISNDEFLNNDMAPWEMEGDKVMPLTA